MNHKREWKVVTLNVGGIKCDMPGCGWRDNTVQSKDYPAWVNRPCPKCGGNLLTEKDMALVRKLKAIEIGLNIFFGWLGVIFPGPMTTVTTMQSDGRGVLTDIKHERVRK